MWQVQLPSAACGLSYWRTRLCRESSCLACSEAAAELYEVGSLYIHSGHTTHAIRPWEFRQADARTPRVTLQAFGVRCDGSWFLWW